MARYVPGIRRRLAGDGEGRFWWLGIAAAGLWAKMKGIGRDENQWD